MASNAAPEIAIIGYAQSPSWREAELTEPQFLFPVISEAIDNAGIDRRDIGFTCAGSCDYLSGQTFAFVHEPRGRRRVAADLRSRTSRWTARGRCTRRGCGSSTATSTPRSCSARASRRRASRPRSTRSRWTRTRSRRSAPTPCRSPRSRRGRCSTAGKITEREIAEVAARSRRERQGQPVRAGDGRLRRRRAARRAVRHRAAAQARPPADLRRRRRGRSSPPRPRPRSSREHPVWIRGIDHRIESTSPGFRDLTESPSTRARGRARGRRRRRRSTSPSCRVDVQPPGDDPARRARSGRRRRRQPVGRSARRATR